MYFLKYHDVRHFKSEIRNIIKGRTAAVQNIAREVANFKHREKGSNLDSDGDVTANIRRNISFWCNADKDTKAWNGKQSENGSFEILTSPVAVMVLEHELVNEMGSASWEPLLIGPQILA
jgi:hypothetical protein